MATGGRGDSRDVPRGGADVLRLQPVRQDKARRTGGARRRARHHHAGRPHVLRLLQFQGDPGRCPPGAGGSRPLRHHREPGAADVCRPQPYRRGTATGGQPQCDYRQSKSLRQHTGLYCGGGHRRPRPYGAARRDAGHRQHEALPAGDGLRTDEQRGGLRLYGHVQGLPDAAPRGIARRPAGTHREALEGQLPHLGHVQRRV